MYENELTEERQAWFPDGPAKEEVGPPPVSEEDAHKEELKKKNAAALAARK